MSKSINWKTLQLQKNYAKATNLVYYNNLSTQIELIISRFYKKLTMTHHNFQELDDDF